MRRVLMVLITTLVLLCGCSNQQYKEIAEEEMVVQTSLSPHAQHELELSQLKLFVVEPGINFEGETDSFVVFVQERGNYKGTLSLTCGEDKADMFRIGDYYFIKLDVQATEQQVSVVTSDGDDLGTIDKLGHMSDTANLHNLVQEVIKTDVGYIYLNISGDNYTVEPLTARGDYSGTFARSADTLYYIENGLEQVIFLK